MGAVRSGSDANYVRKNVKLAKASIPEQAKQAQVIKEARAYLWKTTLL